MNPGTRANNLADFTKALQNLEPVELSFNDMKAIKIQLNSADGKSFQAYIVRKQDEKGVTRFFFTGMNKVIIFDRAPEIWENELKKWDWSFVSVKINK
ncbi:MAG TPA: hypothetical protein DDW50_17695 [Firmicutes bacterium]|jgi:hypothetical protein|nr:hypothetical protein [Bacillota bacterium]